MADQEAQPDLDALYDPPSEAIQQGVLDRLIDFHEDYLRAATFFCLATGRESGLDASPRGGPAGFVKVIDEKTVAFADWPGNNRIESMRNVTADDRVAMLFLFPGLEVFLRINGRARLSVDPDLLDRLKEGEKTPKTAIVVAIDEVLFHCGKAINRARLWSEDSRLDRQSVPSIGKMTKRMRKLDDLTSDEIDAHYDTAMRTNLY
ncbi:MSMEG_1061 family FMN-dependent PPOX-type flavoprotein [Amorphus orientalis]|uniref:PPOX class probable FMN-dependent enzyme n=1 Tax=Amorphus orientalis TaxID=649198 RepID=A0AAE4AUD2_9HYPH|nr:MSMEG_1061 family FMN-dependent PPOX-type flavoprotein [Amorphus orientalis]MDQ0317265.1 PPOX class probable FMN-dependent enzyme [Amorphus orientalis]